MRFTLTAAATRLGVVGDTLKRWEREGKIPRARRDSRNVRFWDEAELDRIRQWIDQRAELARGCAI